MEIGSLSIKVKNNIWRARQFSSPSWLKPQHDFSQILSIYSLKKRRRVLFRCFLSDVDKQN